MDFGGLGVGNLHQKIHHLGILGAGRGLQLNQSGLGLLGAADFLIGAIVIGADELSLPVHYHLRSIDSVNHEFTPVIVLPEAILRGRKRVGPTQRIPIIHVLFERNDPRARNRLGGIHARQKLIGGRTTGAAFTGEQFHDHRHAAVVGPRLCQE